jgi:CheY-like chemotaxis protein
MPVMGGFEATRLIRSEPKNAHLPIIAMTAHAMRGAREECLAAGMNDYISKPIDTAQLFSVMAKWITKKETKRSGETPELHSSLTPSHETWLENLAGIDTKDGLKRLNGNQGLYVKLLRTFAKTYAASGKEIKEAFRGDPTTAERIAHTVKGVAGNISAIGVQHAAQELEMALKQNDLNHVDPLLSRFEEKLAQVVTSIKLLDQTETARDQASTGAVAEDAGRETCSMLKELKTQVEDNNLAACDTFETIAEHLGTGDGDQEFEFGRLRDSLDIFDFETALDAIQKLLGKLRCASQ